MARDRKFDPERMKEILDQRVLSIDSEFGGDKEHTKSKGGSSSGYDLIKDRSKRRSKLFREGKNKGAVSGSGDVEQISMVSSLKSLSKARNKEIESSSH